MSCRDVDGCVPCRLAPLSVCLPTVVAEFSRLVARLGLMDCGALLPQRSQAMRAQRPLEMFFPFDPYLLPRSAQVRRLIWPPLLLSIALNTSASPM